LQRRSQGVLFAIALRISLFASALRNASLRSSVSMAGSLMIF